MKVLELIRHISANNGFVLQEGLRQSVHVEGSTACRAAGLRYDMVPAPGREKRFTSSTQPISTSRLTDFGSRPVVSVSKMISRIALLQTRGFFVRTAGQGAHDISDRSPDGGAGLSRYPPQNAPGGAFQHRASAGPAAPGKRSSVTPAVREHGPAEPQAGAVTTKNGVDTRLAARFEQQRDVEHTSGARSPLHRSRNASSGRNDGACTMASSRFIAAGSPVTREPSAARSTTPSRTTLEGRLDERRRLAGITCMDRGIRILHTGRPLPEQARGRSTCPCRSIR